MVNGKNNENATENDLKPIAHSSDISCDGVGTDPRDESDGICS